MIDPSLTLLHCTYTLYRAPCRPTLPREGAPVLQRATSALLGCATAIALGLASPLAPSASAAPVSLEARRAEQEAAFREQLERMQYSLAQQDNARRAELLGRRQVLESQVTQVEDAIGRKLVEEAANEQAAAKKGVRGAFWSICCAHTHTHSEYYCCPLQI